MDQVVKTRFQSMSDSFQCLMRAMSYGSGGQNTLSIHVRFIPMSDASNTLSIRWTKIRLQYLFASLLSKASVMLVGFCNTLFLLLHRAI
jgi:hypothetical protein